MKLIKCTLLSLIMITILFLSVLSVSSAEVSDNSNNMTSDMNNNGVTCLQENISDLNSSNYQNGNLKDASEFVQNTNLEINLNDSNNEKIDLNNLTSLYNITQTSDKSFILSLPDNITINICRLGIYDLQSFKDASTFISKPDDNYDMIMLEFKDKLNLEIDPWADELITMKNVKNIMINGHGATITVKKHENYNLKHFLNVYSNTLATINNITLMGFDTAILNYGKCQLTNVTFNKNIIDCRYELKSTSPFLFIPDLDVIPNEPDYGGAIRNFGTLNCLNCSFTNNFAQLGGAVYNEKGTESNFINCYFKGNEVYLNLNPSPFSKDFYVYDNEDKYPREIRLPDCEGFDCNNVYDIYTCDLANCFVYNENDEVYIATINNTADLNKFFSGIESVKYMKFCIMNFLPNTTYYIDSDFEGMNYKNIENLIINGNGAVISVKNPKDNNDCNFLHLHRKASCLVKDITFTGFNQVFINQGTLNIVNSTFKNNKCDYIIKEDYGGSIYNDETGLVYLSDTRFEGGYAKYGGAIYNNKGIVVCNRCNFTNNQVYGDGGAIYNAFGIMSCENCIFTSNKADNGGAIMNHYGKVITINNIFSTSTAKDNGGAIYNDFGEITIDNNTFINSQAEEGGDIYSYGEDAKVSVIGESYSITKKGESITNHTMKITEDAPNEIVRYVVRGAEIVLCIALCCTLTFLGVPEGIAAIIGFVGGSLFAGAEEVYEECCLDHNFNLFNCLAMVAISGFFDAVCGFAGTWVGSTFFKVGVQELTAKASFKLGAICFGLELTGELLTEFLPRFDFSNMDMITIPYDDILNPPVQSY